MRGCTVLGRRRPGARRRPRLWVEGMLVEQDHAAGRNAVADAGEQHGGDAHHRGSHGPRAGAVAVLCVLVCFREAARLLVLGCALGGGRHRSAQGACVRVCACGHVHWLEGTPTAGGAIWGLVTSSLPSYLECGRGRRNVTSGGRRPARPARAAARAGGVDAVRGGHGIDRHGHTRHRRRSPCVRGRRDRGYTDGIFLATQRRELHSHDRDFSRKTACARDS